MLRTTLVLTLLLTAGFAAGCGDDDTPTAPTVPPAEITEDPSPSGTLTINGAATHTFIVQRAGQASAQIARLSPDSAAVISLALGTWNGQFCQIILANDAATTNSTVVGNASAGNFCVRVSDVGRLTAPTEYVLTVKHF